MTEEIYDAIIIGAGFSGIYNLIHLRELGLNCKLIEAGSDFGGTWYWNRYPGARVDSDIPSYEFSRPELWKGWTWTERFPGWKELKSYFAYVGEKLDLRKHCRFDSRVTKAHWDDQSHVWHVVAEGKDGAYKASARYLVMCTGALSKPYTPDIKGIETFQGPHCHTARWPEEGVEMTGKKVGVIGTGASGVQVIQEIGKDVEHLTVFQRTPNLALPMRQCAMNKQSQDHFKSVYDVTFNKLPNTAAGFLFNYILRPMMSDSEEERQANFEQLWEAGGLRYWVANYVDILADKTGNYEAYKFWRKKVCERVKDPKKRDLLAPEVPPHPFGCKRPCLEQWFYEIFNQDNVDLVDVNANPILEVTPKGVKTAEQEYELDVLIFATGFDAHTGAFKDIDLRGVGGETIQDHWKDTVTTYLGLTIDNFPNLFFLYGPHGPTSFCNGPACVEVQGEWIVKTIDYLRQKGITKFSPSQSATSAFKQRINAYSGFTLIPQAKGWYNGSNIPGKTEEAYSYLGGLPRYKVEITEEVEGGFPSFEKESLSDATVPHL